MKLHDLIDNINNTDRMKIDITVNLFSYVTIKSIEFNLAKQGSKDKNSIKYEILDTLRSIDFSLAFNYVNDYFENLIIALKENRYKVIDVKVQTKKKTVVGISSPLGKLIFENGISFDPIMNLPYIPGSEIKGSVRATIEEDIGENEAKDLFGSEDRIGLVGFTDAYPVESVDGKLFMPDVITPHYKDARDERDVKPVPIHFITIAPKVTFRFLIYYRDADVKPICSHFPIVLLKGIGAKTSVNYSIFELTSWREVS